MPILSQIPLKNPILGLILGICFGVFAFDRFYKGDIGLGIVKLFLGIFTFGIWYVLDFFLFGGELKKIIFNALQRTLGVL